MEVAALSGQLPPIPGKRYFTIGEVSDLCGVKTHVLRYWEGEFPSLKPMKRRGNRRYYQREDVLLIRQIRTLLYEQGYTISGARQKLLEEAHTPPPPSQPLEPIVVNGNDIAPLVEELERILFLLKY
ncbi:MAG: MerR family transcriptional regulator [Candidatus Thiothrix putei]|jgi:Predicted transcriptional regulators|uniref:DNA-binding transcriptional regulator, MerR family n=2 Tax=Thiothrix TaxID=1030 RepID=A0A1H3YPN6_9GAMM|nr:MerR family transcriptional regulator [Thiothrix caldifontis]WGZ92857.1 MAG: MerR family transcriptional regulator [Candidatus Thiothrix putei]SEA13161.1 DNA-binding transcriptional regulator, MerR family [Thiothrix caldifontis]